MAPIKQPAAIVVEEKEESEEEEVRDKPKRQLIGA